MQIYMDMDLQTKVQLNGKSKNPGVAQSTKHKDVSASLPVQAVISKK